MTVSPSILPLLALALTPPAPAEPVPLCKEAVERGIFSVPGGWLLNPADMQQRLLWKPEVAAQVELLIEALEARGIHLAVVLQPTRGLALRDGEALADAAGVPYDLAAAYGGYRTVTSWFEGHGVTTVDLVALAHSDALEGDYYFPRDHHWTQPTAQLAAQRLAERIAPLGLDLPPASFSTQTLPGDPRSWPGSRGTRLMQICPKLTPPDLSHPRVRTERLDEPQLGLLDEVPTPAVLLVGTSFSGAEFNFPGYLAEALGTEVMTVMMGGAGPLATLMSALRSDAVLDDPPSLIVWEWSVTGLWGRKPDTPDLDDALAWAQILPSARGRCDEPAFVGRIEVAGGEAEPLSLPAPLALPEGSYAALRTGDPSLTNLTLALRDDGGPERELSLPSYGRLRYTGNQFVALGPALQELVEIQLGAPDGAAGSVELTLCEPPTP